MTKGVTKDEILRMREDEREAKEHVKVLVDSINKRLMKDYDQGKVIHFDFVELNLEDVPFSNMVAGVGPVFQPSYFIDRVWAELQEEFPSWIIDLVPPKQNEPAKFSFR